MPLRVLAALFVLLISAVRPLSAQPSVDLEARYWFPRMTATLRVEQGGLGTDIDAKSDLGMKDTNFPIGGVTLRSGRHQLGFSYTPISFSGDQNVARTVIFRGRPYTVGTRVVSDIEIKHLQLFWAYQFIRAANGKFRLGPMLEADGFLMKGSLAAPSLTPPVSEREELSVGLPTVGIAMDIEAHRMVHIYGRVAGMKVGDYGYFVGSDIGVKVRPIRNLFLSAGYRTFNLHVETSRNFSRVQLNGPFVGGGLHF